MAALIPSTSSNLLSIKLWHNTPFQGTAGKLRLPVPSAFLAPAVPKLARWAA
jgi:hypothetical protein